MDPRFQPLSRVSDDKQVEVTVASLTKELLVKGRNGMSMQADTDLDSALATSPFDAVISPTGPPNPGAGGWAERRDSLLTEGERGR